MDASQQSGIERRGFGFAPHYAKFIGRVGPLAFALGVWAAVFTGHGVASAEPSGSDTSGSSAGSDSQSSSESSGSDSATSGSGAVDTSTLSDSLSDADTDVMVSTVGAQVSSAAEIDVDTAAALDAPDGVSSADAVSLPPAVISASATIEETAPVADGIQDSDAAAAITTQLPSESVDVAPTSTQSARASASGLADPTREAVADTPTAATPGRPAVGAAQVTIAAEPAALSPVVHDELPAIAADPLVPAAPAPPVAGFLEFLGREFLRTFFNSTPTIAYNSLENSFDGDRVVGNVNAADPDSEILTYTATDPAQGTAEVRSDGSFTYTPGPEYAGHDTFNITVSDAGNGFQLHGVPALIHLLTFGLFGSDGHTRTAIINIGFDRTVVASGFNSPVDFSFLPDGRIVVAEKDGAIKLVDNGQQAAQPVITLPVSAQGPQGIGGITLDPDFENNGYLYVAYTTDTLRNRLSRITVEDGTASLDSELVLLEAEGDIGGHHHGGGLGFGPDGLLYWGVGDNTIPTNSQDLSTLHGKIARVQPDGTVPADNPFRGTDALPEIYAYGVRNPFRLTFAPDGELLVADVGQDSLEELNNVTAGENYGWPHAEGVCTDCSSVNPVYTYPHGLGAAISAVLVPNGSTFGTINDGRVFIADYIQGWIKTLTCTADYSSCGDALVFDPQAGSTVKLAQGPDGNIYQLTFHPGVLNRISPTGWSPPAF